MNQVITIQIIRPPFEDYNDKEKKIMIEMLSKDIARQIIDQEAQRHRQMDIEYWQHKLLEWQLEDALNEIKHGNKKSTGTW